MYFVEGLANDRIAVVGKIHHALADGVASANLMARGMDLQPGRRPAGLVRPRSGAVHAGADALGVRRPHAPHRADPGRDRATPRRA